MGESVASTGRGIALAGTTCGGPPPIAQCDQGLEKIENAPACKCCQNKNSSELCKKNLQTKPKQTYMQK